MDIYTKAQIRGIEKQRRRIKRVKNENKKARFEEDMKQRDKLIIQASKEKRIRELIDTIKALQIVGAYDAATKFKTDLGILLTMKCQQ